MTPGTPGQTIDLNCDMGELPELVASGAEQRMMLHVSSVNVACGAHAGDELTMEATVRAAAARGCTIGAHPSYPDRESFGRKTMALSPDELARTIDVQIARLAAVVARCGAKLAHVKPHGALYNEAASDVTLARAVAEGVARRAAEFRAGRPVLVGLAGSRALQIYASAGFRVIAEAFADRRYEADGQLRSRALPGALLTDPEEAAAQALSIARDGIVTAYGGAPVRLEAETICIHGDTPGAVSVAVSVVSRLRAAGIAIASPAP